MAYVDVRKLKRSEVERGIDGKLWIYTHRQKTDSLSRIPLLQTALSIIEKYKDHPQCIADDLLLPVISNQKMNSYLKDIAKTVELLKVEVETEGVKGGMRFSEKKMKYDLIIKVFGL